MTGWSRFRAAGLGTLPGEHAPETPLTQSLILRRLTSGRLKFCGLMTGVDPRVREDDGGSPRSRG